MPILPPTIITTAGTFTGQTFQLREPRMGTPFMGVQETFTYGSGGTSVDVYVQTSFDGGTTWCDVIHFAQLTTANARFLASVAETAIGAAPIAAQDGALTVNTMNAGLFGSWWRSKYVVVGTYAGNTTLRVDAFTNVGLIPAGINAFN